MKKTNKKLWVQALRSGKYRQGRGFLCLNNQYCCLGVAFDVLVDDDWHSEDDGHGWGIKGRDTYTTYSGESVTDIYTDECSLTNEVLDKIELDMRDADELVRLNDKGTSFEEIADWIEENIPVT